MHLKKVAFLFIISIAIVNANLQAQAFQYTTTANGVEKFKETRLVPSALTKNDTSIASIQMDPTKRFQTVEGFGFALTGGSATLIDQLPEAKKNALLNEIFGKGNDALGVSYIRISIGASDLDANVFSYDDLKKGETDSLLLNFNLSEDTLHLIPILKKVLAINPSIQIMASPWSPPIWMKTNGASMGGHLLKKILCSLC